MKIRFCVMTGNKEYVPIELEQDEIDKFLYTLLVVYNINYTTPEHDYDVIDNGYDFSQMYIKDDGSFIYKNHSKYKNNNEHFILYNTKIFIRNFYKVAHLDLSHRLVMCIHMDTLNDKDKENLGFEIDGKFINVYNLYKKYSILKNLNDDNYEPFLASGKNRVRIDLINPNCIEIMLDILEKEDDD